MERVSETLKRFSSQSNIPGPNRYDETEETDEEKREALRKNLNLTSWDDTFQNFRALKGTQASLKAFRELASGKVSWHMLLCYGAAGCGKSHLCEALSIELSERGIRARVFEWPALIRFFKRTMHNDEVPDMYNELFERYCQSPWLILDDVGMGGVGSAWEWGEFDELVNYRYRNNLPTVVTTNLDITKLPGRAVSRFRDAIKGRCVLNSGEDYRPKRIPGKT